MKFTTLLGICALPVACAATPTKVSEADPVPPDRYRPDRPQHCPQAGRELLVPTSFTPELIGEAMRVLQTICRPGYQYKKAGVLCLDLVPDEEKQASLF